MVRSKLAAAILSASLALPVAASALGVGDYTLKSYLNQPLDLKIDLQQTKDLTPDEVIARLASQEDFSRAGVERVFFLTDIRFEIVQNADGTMSVVARTNRPVTEPFLNFLVEIQWPQGRLLREYTVLLDPPVYKAGGETTAMVAPAAAAPVVVAPAPVAPVAAAPAIAQPPPAALPPVPAAAVDSGLPPPPSAARRPGAAPAPQPAPRYQPPAPAPAAEAATGAGEYRVQASDTMWEIAARNRAGGVTVQQTMMAIQRANPDAFINDNVNLVRRGAVLRIPTESEVAALSDAEAARALHDQTRAWRELVDQRSAAQPMAAAQIEAGKSREAAAAAPKGTGKGEVTLVAPTASGKGTKASGGKEAAALQNQLAIAEEGLDKAARENKELSSRLADLDKQVKTSEKLLSMKDDEIAGLQSELADLRKKKAGAAAAAAVASAEAAKPAAPAVEPGKPETAVEAPAAAPAQEKIAAAEKKPAVEKKPAKEKVVHKTKPDSGKSKLWPIVGGLVVLGGAAGAGFWFWRKKKAGAPAAVAGAELAADETDAQVAEDLAQLQDFNFSGGEEPEEQREEAGAASAEPADPVGEADMYMAYGRFQQAADILYMALQREPERQELRVKLAEVYAEMGDNESARSHAQDAIASGDAAVRSQAESVLARVGGGAVPAPAAAAEKEMSLDDLALEFSGGNAEPAAAPEAEGDLDFSLDQFEAQPAPAAASAAMDDELSLDDVDFSLDTEAPAAAAPAAAVVAEADELSLDDVDFSLDLESTTAVTPAAAVADDELSLEADLDFASGEDVTAVAPAMPDVEEVADSESPTEVLSRADLEEALQEAVVAEPPAAVPVAQPSDELDLESELADLQADLGGEGVGATAESGGDDFDFLTDNDENATKLDLARAYIDMGDSDGARDILNEVVAEGNATQKDEARKLLSQVG